jgi:hypothetical protein
MTVKQAYEIWTQLINSNASSEEINAAHAEWKASKQRAIKKMLAKKKSA